VVRLGRGGLPQRRRVRRLRSVARVGVRFRQRSSPVGHERLGARPVDAGGHGPSRVRRDRPGARDRARPRQRAPDLVLGGGEPREGLCPMRACHRQRARRRERRAHHEPDGRQAPCVPCDRRQARVDR
jgi:hypothetical protein